MCIFALPKYTRVGEGPYACFHLAHKMGRNGGDIFGNSEKRAPQGRFSTIFRDTPFPERYRGAFLGFLTNDFLQKKVHFFRISRENPPVRRVWRSPGFNSPGGGVLGGVPPSPPSPPPLSLESVLAAQETPPRSEGSKSGGGSTQT